MKRILQSDLMPSMFLENGDYANGIDMAKSYYLKSQKDGQIIDENQEPQFAEFMAQYDPATADQNQITKDYHLWKAKQTLIDAMKQMKKRYAGLGEELPYDYKEFLRQSSINEVKGIEQFDELLKSMYKKEDLPLTEYVGANGEQIKLNSLASMFHNIDKPMDTSGHDVKK